jgi:hypothetical protein
MTRPTAQFDLTDPVGRERTVNVPTTLRLAPPRNFIIVTKMPIHAGDITLTTSVEDARVGITTSYASGAEEGLRGPLISSRRIRDLAAALVAHAEAIDEYEQERDA